MRDQQVFLIGGMPSSGSTLLTNLLGQCDGILALPETGLFAHGRSLGKETAPPACRRGFDLSWLLTGPKVSGALGWPEDVYQKALAEGECMFALLRRRIDPDFNFRLIEKTPENIFAFDAYLSADPERRVVATSRDLVSVVQSLVRRGFSLAEACLIWFAYGIEIALLLDRYPDQVLLCDYQNLTRKPIAAVQQALQFWQIETATTTPVERDRAKQLLLCISSWQLEDTSWSHSPAEAVAAPDPINLIGLQLDLFKEHLAFSKPGAEIVTLTALDEFLSDPSRELEVRKTASYGFAKLALGSSFTEVLARHYTPYWRTHTGTHHSSGDRA